MWRHFTLCILQLLYLTDFAQTTNASWPARQNRAVDRARWSSAINYSGRTSEFGGAVNLVGRRRSSLYFAFLSVHHCPAKSITRFDDRYAKATLFKSGVLDKCPEERYANFFLTQCRIGGRKLSRQNQLDSFSRFDTTPTCERHRQTDRQTGP